MLEYFRKKHQSTGSVDSTKAPNEQLTPLLAPNDERFLAQVIDEPEGTTVIFHGSQLPQAPAVAPAPDEAPADSPPTTAPPVTAGDGDWKQSLRDKWGYLGALGTVTAARLEQAVVGKGKLKEKEDKGKGKEKATEASAESATATPGTATPTGTSEIIREDQELTEVLERVNCAAANGTVFSSPKAAIKPLIDRFTQIFKDLVNGVPTAYDDLISLFESSSSLMEKTYSSLPSFIKQIIQSMPQKMTPEVLRTLAATSPALASVGSMGLKEMVTTPGVLTNLYKAIVQLLKARFPMLLGGGVAVGLGMFVLFFGLWYCYKRGKETREEREENERMETFGVERIKSEKELEKEKKEKEKAEKKKKEEETAGPAKKRWWSA